MNMYVQSRITVLVSSCFLGSFGNLIVHQRFPLFHLNFFCVFFFLPLNTYNVFSIFSSGQIRKKETVSNHDIYDIAE